MVAALRAEEDAERAAAAMPSYGTTVSVTSQSQAGAWVPECWGALGGLQVHVRCTWGPGWQAAPAFVRCMCTGLIRPPCPLTCCPNLQKLISKLERKADRRCAKQGTGGGGGGGGASGDPDADWLALNGVGALVEEEIEKETAHMRLR